MNVTKTEAKCSQLPSDDSCKEDSLQKNSAENEGYAGVYSCGRITENNITNADMLKDRLLEKIVDRDNMNNAYKRVKSNKGAHGVDGMKVDELLQYLKENGGQLRQSILDGKHRPNPVRRVEIPKEDGKKKRKLGIPTVVDRVVQQAIAQAFTPIFEKQFSDNSYGFRPGRSAHDAIKKCQNNIEEGYKYVVDMDLEKYFDSVNQSKLIEVVSRTIKDGRVKILRVDWSALLALLGSEVPPRALVSLGQPLISHVLRAHCLIRLLTILLVDSLLDVDM